MRIVLDPDDRPVTKGTLCSQDHGFNQHAATRVAANDKRLRLEIPQRSETVLDLGDDFKVAAADELLAKLEQVFGERVALLR